jgi:hypothetical protein
VNDVRLPSSVLTVIPGTLWAVGGSIPGRPHPSWMPADTDDWIPLQCYVLRNGDEAVIIDTGTAVHAREIREGLAALLDGVARADVVMTRREPDNGMNLYWIAREFPVRTVRCGGDLNPLDFFESFDDANAEALVKSASAASFDFVRAGDIVTGGPFILEAIRPPLRVLHTTWFYERSTGTMFCSDSWSHIARPGPLSPAITRPAPADLDVGYLVDFLDAKFDFLWSIDTEPIAAELREVMAEHPTERLCPSYGCIVNGKRHVAEMLQATERALGRLAAASARSDLERFTFTG